MSSKLTCLILIWVALQIAACGSMKKNANPSSPGFNEKGSDSMAIKIADEVMEAMGGRRNWDNTRFLTWTFFGRRNHAWDKWTGDVRIESMADSTIYLLNINSMKGRVSQKGTEVDNPDTLAFLLKRAKSIWINDSYWLIMPFKLKDNGVTLKYLGEGKTEKGILTDILELTFKEVGDTPDNKYQVFVDKDLRLVTQWSYFRSAGNEKPDFTNPWEDYQKYGKLLLSGSRGSRFLTPITAPKNLPLEKFSTF